MFDELETLWSRLSMPEDYADNFAMAHTGVSDVTLQAVRVKILVRSGFSTTEWFCYLQYEQELADMQEQRRAHLPRFTNMAREQINRLWDEMMIGPRERAKFPAIQAGESFSYRDIFCYCVRTPSADGFT